MTTDFEGVMDPEARRRANAYFALARALEPPARWESDLPDLVEAALTDLGEPLASMGHEMAVAMDGDAPSRADLSVAHARLLLGPFQIQAAPWASFYLEEEPRLMGRVSQYAAASYAGAGLAPGDNLRDAPDHVTHELEFMYFLAHGQATIGEPIWTNRQRRFWTEHLGRWLPRFARAVAEADPPGFYRILARALEAFSDREEEVLGGSTRAGDEEDDEHETRTPVPLGLNTEIQE